MVVFIVYWGYIGIMEKKMEAAIAPREAAGYIDLDDDQIRRSTRGDTLGFRV